jgi:hypothetical protein
MKKLDPNKAIVIRDERLGPKKKYEYREVEVAGMGDWGISCRWGSQAPIPEAHIQDGKLVVRLRRQLPPL